MPTVILPENSAIDRAYGAIQRGILDGRYPPGSHLTERDLAADLGISRTPVREALRLLSADGFAHHRPNSGVTVLQLSAKAVSDLAELRAHLAEFAGRLAATALDDAALDTLDALAAHIGAVIVEAGPQVSTEVLGLFRRFHLAVIEGCDNDWLARAFSQTTFLSVMHATYEDLRPSEWAAIARYYPDLVVALRLRDPDLSASLMRSYFLSAKYRLLRAYQSHVERTSVTERGRSRADGRAAPVGKRR